MSNKVYAIVTENIIKMLDAGVVPWRKPWKSRGGSLPRNAWGRPYRGINVFILATQAAFKGYRSSFWLTMKQVNERGGRVTTGEHPTLVIFWTTFEVEDKTAKSGKKRVPVLRYFNVFNLDQTTGVKLTKRQADEQVPEPETEHGPIEDAEAIIGTYLASDNAPKFDERKSDRAFYVPKDDSIVVPSRTQYDDVAGFYATVFHEFSHSTGAESRLNREGVNNFDHFGSGQYAAEELVAEMGAAYLCAEAGIDNTLPNSAAYISNWKSRLQDDPTLIVKAAGKAQKAADFILGTTFEKDGED